jgi:hypothetical protein
LEVVITSGWTTTATKKEKQPRLETEVGGKIDSHGTTFLCNPSFVRNLQEEDEER